MKTGRNPKPRTNVLTVKTFFYKTNEKICLVKPQQKSDVLFFDVLESRRSSKDFSPPTLNQISELLWHCAKVRKVMLSKDGLILTKTNTPSAGALHPIDLFISLGNDLNQRCLHYYNPFDHSIEKLELEEVYWRNFLDHVNESMDIKNYCLIWFGMDFYRTNTVYENPESLLWRDAGALLMTVQLVAQSLHLHSCPIGTLGEPYFSQLFNSYKLLSAGGIVLG